MVNPYSQYSDSDLWQAFKQGDEEAYGYIYRRYAPSLYNYGRHFIKNAQLVEDCLHDLFVYLHQHRTRLSATDSIKFYLLRALRRRITEATATQQNYADSLDHLPDSAVGSFSSPELMLIEEQSSQIQNKQLMTAIQQLPKRQQEALYLLYYDGLSYKQVAAVMSLEVRTVYNQVHNALEALKKHFAKFPLHLLLLFLLILCL